MSDYQPIPETGDVDEAKELATSLGRIVLRGGHESLDDILRWLGSVISVHEVQLGPRGRVDSNRAISPHTDHHRAHWIVWKCVQQAERGGESVVVDALEVLRRLSLDHQSTLTKVSLFEPRMFEGDEGMCAVVTPGVGRTRLYYGDWLAREPMACDAKAALEAFTEGVRCADQQRSRLTPGDLLIVDNHRVLHGRTAFEGGNRRLTRYWLGEAVRGKEQHPPGRPA